MNRFQPSGKHRIIRLSGSSPCMREVGLGCEPKAKVGPRSELEARSSIVPRENPGLGASWFPFKPKDDYVTE